MSGFTKGPWHWDDKVPTSYLGANWEEVAPWLVDGNGDSVLDGKIACPNQKNLHLIAAAPCLFEVLSEIINEGGKFVMTQDTHRKARAAIAKARGEA